MRTATATCAASTEPGPSTGNSFSTTLSFGSLPISVDHVVERALAVAAIVVEELHEGDVALRIAERDLARRIEQRLGVVLDRRARLFGFGDGLLLLELRHHLLQHFGMLEQVLLDDLLDLAALRVEKSCAGAGVHAGERERGGGEQSGEGGSLRAVLCWPVPVDRADGEFGAAEQAGLALLQADDVVGT